MSFERNSTGSLKLSMSANYGLCRVMKKVVSDFSRSQVLSHTFSSPHSSPVRCPVGCVLNESRLQPDRRGALCSSPSWPKAGSLAPRPGALRGTLSTPFPHSRQGSFSFS